MRWIVASLASFALLCAATFVIGPSVVSAAPTQNRITVETVPGISVTEKVIQKAHSSWPWYLARASGLVAAVALVMLMVSGVGQVTGFTYRLLEPLTAWASHRALGIVFGVSVVLHTGSLLFDHFLPFSLGQLLVPWLSNYKPATVFGLHLGSLWLALGILALYLVGIIIITSLVWIDKKPHIWKWLHLLSYIVMFFVFVHALYLGTDVAHGWLRIMWLASAGGIVWLGLHRVWRAYTT